MTERECKKIIDKIVKDFTEYKHHSYKGSQDSPKNIDEFKPFLVKLCDLAPYNLKELLIGTYQLGKYLMMVRRPGRERLERIQTLMSI